MDTLFWSRFICSGSKTEVDVRDEGILSSDFNEDSIPIILDDELKILLNEVRHCYDNARLLQ